MNRGTLAMGWTCPPRLCLMVLLRQMQNRTLTPWPEPLDPAGSSAPQTPLEARPVVQPDIFRPGDAPASDPCTWQRDLEYHFTARQSIASTTEPRLQILSSFRTTKFPQNAVNVKHLGNERGGREHVTRRLFRTMQVAVIWHATSRLRRCREQADETKHELTTTTTTTNHQRYALSLYNYSLYIKHQRRQSRTTVGNQHIRHGYSNGGPQGVPRSGLPTTIPTDRCSHQAERKSCVKSRTVLLFFRFETSNRCRKSRPQWPGKNYKHPGTGTWYRFWRISP